MSYDICLKNKVGNVLEMKTTHIGGTMPVGGYRTTDFNITYNYSWFYYHFLDKEQGIRWLYGKTGKQTIKRLQFAIKELGTDPYFELPDGIPLEKLTEEDRIYKYWTPTPGNAGAALVPLLEAAISYPSGVWEGD